MGNAVGRFAPSRITGLAVLILAAAMGAPANAGSNQAVTYRADTYRAFETRPGVMTPALIVAPEHPRAVVILFTGGKGVIGAQSGGTLKSGANFLVESRYRFAEHGLVAMVLDPPSDHADGGMESDFRQSATHAADIGRVMVALRKTYDLPIWLVGTSRGTVSVANAGIRLRESPPDGLVLTSSIAHENPRGGNLLDLNLGEIRPPVLVAHHLEDDCWVTPYAGAVEIEEALTGSRAVTLLAIEGGAQKGNTCKPYSHHGFWGRRDAVVKAIADWILGQSPKT
jgi:hypothetical protein